METGEKKSLIRRLKDVPPVRLIVSSFFIIIVIGAVLLALPISARDRQATDLLSSFFYIDFRYLRHRIGGIRHLDPLVRLWAGGHFRPDSAGRSGTGNLHQWIYIVSATQAGSKGYADRQRVYKRQYLGSSPFAPHHYVFYLCLRGFRFFSSNAALCPYVWGQGNLDFRFSVGFRLLQRGL